MVLGAALLAWVALPAVAAMAADAPGGLCAALRKGGTARLAVLAAFPAELAPLVAAAKVERVELEGRPFYEGELAGVRVVIGMTRIGMVNAALTAELLLANFDIAGFVFSGVAGSPRQIGEVAVATEWLERSTGMIFPTNPFLVALAQKATRRVPLDRCTLVTFTPPVETVCFPCDPVVVVGGRGVSGDPFGGRASECNPNPPPVIAEVSGCDIYDPGLPPEEPETRADPCPPLTGPPPADPPMSADMETAAVARVAAAHGVPFVGFRGVSDGAGDPRGDRGFPTQFFDYYRLAADNSAAATVATVKRFKRLAGGGNGPLCRALARERWDKAVRMLRPR
jgi:adenosylhomocysteine nucleosidase